MRKSIFLFFALFFVFSINAQNIENITYSHLPGVYKEDISLNIQIPDELKIYINFTPDVEDAWVIYKEPLELSALNGEERDYTIGIRAVQDFNHIIDQRELKFTIDKNLPLTPEIEPKSGEFTEELCKVGLKVYAIDPWSYYKNYRRHPQEAPMDDIYNEAKEKLKKR